MLVVTRSVFYHGETGRSVFQLNHGKSFNVAKVYFLRKERSHWNTELHKIRQHISGPKND